MLILRRDLILVHLHRQVKNDFLLVTGDCLDGNIEKETRDCGKLIGQNDTALQRAVARLPLMLPMTWKWQQGKGIYYQCDVAGKGMSCAYFLLRTPLNIRRR
jgi:hypothetical protein